MSAPLRMHPENGDLMFTLAFLGMIVVTIAIIAWVQSRGYDWTPDRENEDD